MTKKEEIESEMISLQNLMNGLQVKEAAAHKKKQEAEIEISACNNYWFELYKQYEKCKNDLKKLTK